MAGIVDCSDFCRLCLVKEQVNNPIFEDDGRNRQVHTKISTCLPVKVTWEDALPKRICDGCNYKLDQQFQFWSTSVNSEKQLKQWLGIVDEEEPKPAVKTKKEKLETSASKRPRRNARRKAVQNIRQAVAAQQQSDSDDGEPLASLVDRDSDFDYNDTITKEETNSENDFPSNNTDSVEPTTFVNVTLDNEIGQAGPSGIQKPSVADTGETEAPEGYKTEPSEDDISYYLEISVDENKYTIKEENTPEIKETKSITESNIYQCIVCSKTFKEKKSLKVHGAVHSEERPYKCTICSKSFKYSHNLSVHSKIHEEKRYECDICYKKFSQKGYIKVHTRKHFNEFRHFCKICSKGFHHPHQLNAHQQTNHKTSEFICDVCNNKFKSYNGLKCHKKVHVNPQRLKLSYACEFCNKCFNLKSVRREHIKRTHTGERKCICDICGKELSSSTSLRDHQFVHLGKKPIECDVCKKTFSKKGTLLVHRRTHTGERPYQCSECGKRFTQRSSLRIHKRYHTGDKPYACQFCVAAFVTKTLLKDHLKKQHKIVLQPQQNTI